MRLPAPQSASYLPHPVQVAVTINTVKYRHHLHASDFLHLAASMTLALALYPWSRRLPSHYQRWREVVCCVLRVYLTIMPLFRPLALLIGTQVCRRTGLQERLVLFTAGTAFISHGVRLAILGLALPIRAGAHAALQLALVLLAAQQNEQTCRVVLTAGASLAGIRGESAAGPLSVPGSSSSTCSSSGCMHSPEEELAAAAVSGMMRVQFSAVSFVSMWLRPALPLPPQLSVAQQCRCLLGMYLFFLGFLVPVLVPMLVESRMYAEHRSGQGHSGGQEGTVPPEEKCVMARVYVAVWRCVERMNAPTLACAALLVLAVTWEAITTTVWRSSVLPHMYSDV